MTTTHGGHVYYVIKVPKDAASTTVSTEGAKDR